MSRIGKQPIAIPSGVDVSVENNVLKFKKGNHLKELDTKGHVDVKIENGHIVFAPKGEDRQSRAYWGTYRALANNIVTGITHGFTRQLEINGVGYKAAAKGKIFHTLSTMSYQQALKLALIKTLLLSKVTTNK